MAIERGVVVADTHGYMLDWDIANTVLDFIKDFKPKHRIHLGDAFDMSPLRYSASETDQSVDMEKDLTDGYDFLEKFRPTVNMVGNHEYRLWEFAENPNSIKRGYAMRLIDEYEHFHKQIGCHIVSYSPFEGYYKLGKMVFLHGIIGGMYAPMRNAKEYGPGTVCIGHVHYPGYAITLSPFDLRECYTIGSLANFAKMKYAYRKAYPLAWWPSINYFFYNTRTGSHQMFMAKPNSIKEWIFPVKEL